MGLSKEQMRDVIQAGGSVMYQGKLITNVDQLVKVGGTEAEKKSEIEQLKKRLAELEGSESQSAPGEEKTGQNSGESGAGEGEGEEGGKTSDSDDTKAELMRHTRAELVAKAQDAGIETSESETKAEIVEKILGGKGK